METNFKIGDKVRIPSSDVVDRTGVIVAECESVGYGRKDGSIFSEAKPKGKILTWWNVKMDDNGEIEKFSNNDLECIE